MLANNHGPKRFSISAIMDLQRNNVVPRKQPGPVLFELILNLNSSMNEVKEPKGNTTPLLLIQPSENPNDQLSQSNNSDRNYRISHFSVPRPEIQKFLEKHDTSIRN